MNRTSVALIVLAIVGIGAFLAVVDGLGIVASLVATILLVVLPGAGLARILLPAETRSLASWAAIAVGLGLALAVIVGVALDLLPVGIRYAPAVMLVASVLSAKTLAPAALRGLRHWRVPPGNWTRQVGLISLSFLLATGAFAGARFAAQRQGPAELTQLWMLPATGNGVRVGVTNVGEAAQGWRLVVREGTEVLADEPSIDLQPGEGWEITVDVPIRDSQVTATLFRPGGVQPAYEVTLSPGID
jgi:uncharacterized membrane protein